MIRAKDLAHMLGVSAATISLVLNDKPGICEDTRMELRRRIVEMGYGYMLSTPGEKSDAGGCGTFAFVVYPSCRGCGETTSFYAAVMEGASALLREKNFQMVMVYTQGEGEGDLHSAIQRSNARGLIIHKPYLSPEELRELRETGLPFVMVNTCQLDEEISGISVNNEQGLFKLARHLHEQGHERIGYVHCDTATADFCQRQRYYRVVLSRLGLPQKEEWCISAGDAEGLRRLAAEPGGPTAFLTDNDAVACRTVCQLQEFGYSVPGDVAVAGFEDRDIAQLSSPTLTTVRMPDRALGRIAAETLLSQICDAHIPPRRVELGVELVVRESTVKGGGG